MKNFLEEYGMTIVYVIIAVVLLTAIGSFTYNNQDLKSSVPEGKNESQEPLQLEQTGGPVLEIKSGRVRKGTEFKPLEYVLKAEDSKGNNIIDNLKWTGAEDVNTSEEGVYKIQYTLMDDQYRVVRKEVSFLVD